MFQQYKLLLYTIRSLAIILLLGVGACAGKKNESGEKQKPAEVTNPVKENTLTTIRLTPEAEERLGINTKAVEMRDVPQTLKIGGEIMAPPGQEIKVTAPITGTIVSAANGSFPVAGSFVKKGQEIMRLIFLPPEMDIISAREEVNVKQMEYEVALAEAERAEKLLASQAISERDYEAVNARLTKAKALLNAAIGRLSLYQGENLNDAAENLSTFSIESPINGVIQKINVSQQQTIAASSVILEVSPTNRFWIRVPVYSGDLLKIDRSKKALISTMGDESESENIYAGPVQGPLISDATSASSDLFYTIDNANGIFRSGQKVSVVLTLKSTGTNLVVPYSSIIYDMYGGNWLYVKVEPQLYLRTRVELDYVSDTLAVLTRGVSPGDEVVFEGAAELYGTEFGLGK